MKSVLHTVSPSLILLSIISLLFFVTRLHFINLQPPSLYWDEASIGYNAYSILKTGRDEWGQLAPIHFQAFGEYKLPVYIYSVAISEFITGNGILAIRIPAVIFSFGIVLLLFGISKKLFNNTALSLFSSFLFVIEPWFFIFSRTGYEVTAGLCFFLLGIYCLLNSAKNGWFIISGFTSLILASYSYNSFRILVPLFLILFIAYLILAKELVYILKKEWQKLLLSAVIILFSVLPIINLYYQSGGLKRFSDTSIFSTGIGIEEGVSTTAYNYFRHFSPNFLFLTGDQNSRSHTGNVGELYWIQVFFIIGGMIYLLKHRSKEGFLLLGVLFIAPIPASITKESPHALRACLMVIPLTILTSIGIVKLINKFKWKHIGYAMVLLSFCLLFSVYYSKYIKEYDKFSAEAWQYGYKEIIDKYGSEFSKYDHVLISDRYNQPYIFYLQYLSFDPHLNLEKRILNKEPRVETSLVKQINTVEFGEVHFADFSGGSNLIFAHPSEKLSEITAKDTILNPDNSVAFYVYEYKK